MLLLQLLKVDPKERPASMEDVLNHAFFTNRVDEGTQLLLAKVDEVLASQRRVETMMDSIKTDTMQIKDVSAATLGQVIKTEEVLRKAIFDATEVHVPTCFVIVNQKLTRLPGGSGGGARIDDGKGAGAGAGAGAATAVDAVDSTKVDKAQSWMNKVWAVTKAAGQVADKVLNAREPLAALASEVANLVPPMDAGAETYYFYLVDELTMAPIYPEADDDERYPVVIKQPSQTMKKLLPLMNVALKGVMLYNGAAGIAQCLGWPVPKVRLSTLCTRPLQAPL